MCVHDASNTMSVGDDTLGPGFLHSAILILRTELLRQQLSVWALVLCLK